MNVPHTRLRIVLGYPVQACHLSAIKSVAPHAQVVDPGQERLADQLMDSDIFCGHAKVPVPWDQIVKRGTLKWIQSSAAGLDHCLVPSVIESPILVTGASGLFADAVAEQAMALALGLLRRLPTFLHAQRQKIYERRPTDDLHEKTVGIVGFGGNGRRLAQVLAPFRVRTWATDCFPIRKPRYVQALWPADALEQLLTGADIVFLCVPLTAQTRGMLNEQTLARMKRGAILINVARGPVVVEAALVQALQSGHLAGAGLDVAEQEPLPPTSPLWDLPQVIITPHVAAQCADRYDRVTRLFCKNLRRYLAGQPLVNLVDKRLGFPRPVERSGVERL